MEVRGFIFIFFFKFRVVEFNSLILLSFYSGLVWGCMRG